MTAELYSIQFRSREKETHGKISPKDAFPGSRYRRVSSGRVTGKIIRRTLPMNPQKRASGLPLFEMTAPEEPV